MGSPSPLLLDLPAANHLAAPGFVYERRQPELGALHRAVRTGWPQVKVLGSQLALGYNADIGPVVGLSGLRPRWRFANRNRVLQRWNQRGAPTWPGQGPGLGRALRALPVGTGGCRPLRS